MRPVAAHKFTANVSHSFLRLLRFPSLGVNDLFHPFFPGFADQAHRVFDLSIGSVEIPYPLAVFSPCEYFQLSPCPLLAGQVFVYRPQAALWAGEIEGYELTVD